MNNLLPRINKWEKAVNYNPENLEEIIQVSKKYDLNVFNDLPGDTIFFKHRKDFLMFLGAMSYHEIPYRIS